MTIQIQVENEEFDLTFESIGHSEQNSNFDNHPNAELWKSVANQFNATAEFVNDGMQILHLEFSPNIVLVENDFEGTKNLLILRVQEQLKTVIDSRDSGIEYTAEPTGITPLTQPKPYDPDKIKVRQDKFSVEYVVTKMIGRGIVDLNPDFQRKFVWDKKRQSNLIESLMLGIPIPIFYLAEGINGTFHVIDGLQRLSTLRDFLNNKFALRNLEHLSDYDGCFYSTDLGAKRVLDPKMLTRIETAQLHFNIIEATSPSEVKFDIFTRLNTGGQPLNNQEVRNCLAEPHVRRFLQLCSNSAEFKQATGDSIKSKRMEDQEMVLRFAGFYMQKINRTEYTGDMNPFLNDILDLLNKSTEIELEEIKAKFINAMMVAHHLFGRYTFRKCVPTDLRSNARKQFINKSMFIVWSILLSEYDFTDISTCVEFASFAPTVANAMVTITKTGDSHVTHYNPYYWHFTSGTSDKKSLNQATILSQNLLEVHLNPLLS